MALLAASAYLARRQAVSVFGRAILPEDVMRLMTLVVLTAALCFFGTFLLTALEGIPLREAAFEAVSALSTTGASLGTTSAMDTPGLLVLMALMMIDTIGSLTATLLLVMPYEGWVKVPPRRVFIG